MLRAAFFAFALLAATWTRADGLAIVANPAVPVNSIGLEDLTLIYLVQKTAWPDGTPIVPVNREAASAVRQYFSEQVFNRTPADMSEYWNRLLFKGKTPPLVQTSDAAVLSFVSKVPGAIGYVDAERSAEGAKVLLKLQ